VATSSYTLKNRRNVLNWQESASTALAKREKSSEKKWKRGTHEKKLKKELSL